MPSRFRRSRATLRLPMRSAYAVIVVVACGAPITAPSNRATARATDRLTDSTLALLEPARGACILRRVDPVADVEIELARFPNACFGARISWRADLQRALVWFAPGNAYASGYSAAGAPAPGHADEDVTITERRYEVDLVTHEVSSIAAPTTDRSTEIAYGADGSLLAFAEREVPNASGVVTIEGRVLDFTQVHEGLPAAAITYRRSGGAWKIASVVATTIGWDYARGWSASPEAAGIGPRSNALLEAHSETSEVADAATRTVLDQIAKSKPDGDGWAQITTAAAAIYVWMFNAEFVSTTGRIAWRRADSSIELLPELGFTGGELVAISSRGRFLLVAGSNAGAFPRLYDLVGHRLVYASETARAVTFWPTR